MSGKHAALRCLNRMVGSSENSAPVVEPVETESVEARTVLLW